MTPPTAHVEPVTLAPPTKAIYRVGRAVQPLYFAEISASDAALPRAGNRFDVAGGGVMYCATRAETCYAETLARFRPTAKVRAMVTQDDGIDKDFMVVGGVPADWRTNRLKVGVVIEEDSLPFLDAEHPDTHEYLNVILAEVLEPLGVDNLDTALVRGPDRRITRAISSWAFAAADSEGDLQFAGLRYLSRLDNQECWAVFEGALVREVTRDTIRIDDPDLQAIAKRYGLRPF